MWKQFISDYLNFTKKERNGTLAILTLIAVLIILPFLFPFFIQKKVHNLDTFQKEIASLRIKQIDSSVNHQRKNYGDDQPAYYQSSEKNYSKKEEWKGQLFYFDPNTLDETGWKKLGVRDKTIATIKNYVSKGGKFHQPEDIRKIWGLSDEEKERLEPYISLETSTAKNLYQTKNDEKPKPGKQQYGPAIIDVNIADTTAFIALPGIGSKLSQRIITFREKLGGFYNLEQVGETFGLPDSTFQKIKPRLALNNPVVKQLNVNTASLDELKSHPYLRYAVANAIVQYRNQHGNFATVSDIKKIMTITEDIFVKAAPYLKIN